MFYLIHGDDSVNARLKATVLLGKSKITNVDGKNLILKTFEELTKSTSLFAETSSLLIENFFLKNKNKKEIVEFLNTSNTSKDIVFWEDGVVRKTAFASLKDLKVLEFSLPKNYFAFLDSLSPQNTKRSRQLFQELLASYAPEQLFYSLIKRTRQLIVLKEGSSHKVKETSKMASWQLDRLQSQAAKWPEGALQKFYTKLHNAEIKLKSGGLPMELSKHLDVLLLGKA